MTLGGHSDVDREAEEGEIHQGRQGSLLGGVLVNSLPCVLRCILMKMPSF